MKERPECRSTDRVVHIDIVQDDHGVETAELHYGPLQELSGAFRQQASRFHAADEIDDSDLGTIEELVCDRAGGSRRMSHDVNHASGESGFLRTLGEHNSCRYRCEFGWLDDDGISGRHGRYDGSP